MLPIALDTQDTLRFATVDTIKHKKLSEKLQVDTSRASTLVIKDLDNQLYHFPTDTTVTQQSIRDWLQAYQRGELKPYVKAQSTPPEAIQNDDSVMTVDDQNFEELVLDNTTDVLLEFYAPWCGHCKR